MPSPRRRGIVYGIAPDPLHRGPFLRLASAFARARLDTWADGEAPRPVLAALRAAFDGRPGADVRAVLDRVAAARAELLARGAADLDVPRPGARPRHSMRHLARVSSVPPFWGHLLHLLAAHQRACSIIELGSCVGISGCFLATAPACERFVTVERRPDYARLAAATLRHVTDRAESFTMGFDEALDALLPMRGGVDLVFLDGVKAGPDNVRWVRKVLPHVNEGGLVVIDDIHCSASMQRAWDEISALPGVGFTIDAGRMGICIRQAAAASAARSRVFAPGGVNLASFQKALWRLRSWRSIASPPGPWA